MEQVNESSSETKPSDDHSQTELVEV
ncbi:unnamed protein product, partial [Rotaria socialis]